MTLSRSLLVAVGVLVAAPVGAVNLAAGPLQSSTALVCSVSNIGTKPVVVEVHMRVNGADVGFDTCGGNSLPPGVSCGSLFVVSSGTTQAYCTAKTSSAKVRGSFYVQTNNTTAAALPLTK